MDGLPELIGAIKLALYVSLLILLLYYSLLGLKTMAHPLNVLLVLSDLDSIEVLLRLLSPRGHEVRATNSINEALAIFDEDEFDVLISDITLPDEDGCELVRKLLCKQPSLFTIANCGDCADKDVQRCLKAGFRRLLGKPYSVESLDLLLKEACRENGQA